MLTTIAQQVLKEMKTQPVTLMLVLSLLGSSVWGYNAYAENIYVDDKVKTLKIEIKKLEARIINNGTKTDQVLLLVNAEAIRAQHQIVCNSKNDIDRMLSQRTLDTLQNNYKQINGTNYPISRCR